MGYNPFKTKAYHEARAIKAGPTVGKVIMSKKDKATDPRRQRKRKDWAKDL